MSRWRLILLASLSAAPLILLAGFGGYELWQHGWTFWAWWVLAGSWCLALVLAWYWQRHNKLLPMPDFTPSLAWTDRDLLTSCGLDLSSTAGICSRGL